ncbi:hypothetical protein GCM10011491_30250 [Brucella endophytica]|uniref:Uncharacterized protein n=1 Tax=Brucella endophytica TaxID=1963359 RepID=A0A916SHY1_9HYPH|nr:hypothetical protein [Brucella endophytica]GGA99950.1 hypothetical protein GCM10011491_30250 [Brucella endophytica]
MLTKEEKAWVKKLQKVLDECPSERLGFFTIGDPDVSIYDKTNEVDFDATVDLPVSIYEHDAELGSIRFPSNVHSVSG